jgi:hypothetical protein
MMLKKAEEKNKLKKNTADMLEWQKQNMAENIRKEKELNEFEENKLKDMWEQDIINAKIEKEKKQEKNKQLYIGIAEFNEKELEERKRKALEEKNRDRDLIDTILKREKHLDEIDKREKVKFIYIFND